MLFLAQMDKLWCFSTLKMAIRIRAFSELVI